MGLNVDKWTQIAFTEGHNESLISSLDGLQCFEVWQVLNRLKSDVNSCIRWVVGDPGAKEHAVCQVKQEDAGPPEI